MSADLQLVRGNVEGGYNLAIGEPVLLQKHLNLPKILGFLGGTERVYPYPTMDGDPYLLEELRRRHPTGEIVIANGAKQALLAAFYALKEVENRTIIRHKAPYWPSYPTLARMSGCGFNNDHDSSSDTMLVATSPNNPDGSEDLSPCDIWDAVYAHQVWGWSGCAPDHRIAIYSASKELGLSGLRVGWAVVKDPNLAVYMRRYVEFTTSGVSVLSQRAVADCMWYMRQMAHYQDPYQMVRNDMQTNANALKNLLGDVFENVDGFPVTGKGMFAWVKVKDGYGQRFERACSKARVALVDGIACGISTENGLGVWRINMCQNVEYTRKAFESIKERL